jgi:hypothetical protein
MLVQRKVNIPWAFPPCGILATVSPTKCHAVLECVSPFAGAVRVVTVFVTGGARVFGGRRGASC